MRTLLLSAALMGASPLAASDTAPAAPHVSIELNTAETQGTGCTLTFVVLNGHDRPVDQAIYETVLFTPEGQVERLTLFDFGALPPGRPRVRQFAVPDLTCEGLGQVLFNGADTCTAPELPDDACAAGLALSSRTPIEVAG